ncbi:aspartic proteinase-like protein 2-like [Trifolium medium]|uniref:Aspartic proteinase-like protein 2-like n=1 Tax=Trifolium medium TaxID=97028 RepID=A0A392PJ56_9FABA|nr:aspartic proteinase-like protein 2-like [Trifolium medium]
MSDRVHFDTVSQGVATKNSSAHIVFGNHRSGYFSKSEKTLDGVFGFGHQEISVISQLSAQGVTPRVFSHCQGGDINGGGALVLGEIVEPDIVYTPLVPSQ